MDILKRINNEPLVIANTVNSGLKKFGLDINNDLPLYNICEKDLIFNIVSSYVYAGCHCVLANTQSILPSVLTYINVDNKILEIAQAALEIVLKAKPQHILVPLGDCMLPLDSYSKNSLIEFKEQYVKTSRIFEKISKDKIFDGYYLTGLDSIAKIKCALMGIRQVSDKPIFVSTKINKNLKLNSKEDLFDYLNVLYEYGANVVGIDTYDNVDDIINIVSNVNDNISLPILVNIQVENNKNSLYYSPDTMKNIVYKLNNQIVQFYQASNYARPAHCSVLAATSCNMYLQNG